MKTIRLRITILTGVTIFLVSLLLSLTSIKLANDSIDMSSIVTESLVLNRYDGSAEVMAIAENDKEVSKSNDEDLIRNNSDEQIIEQDSSLSKLKNFNQDYSYQRLSEIQRIINHFNLIQMIAVLLATLIGSLITYFIVGKAMKPLNILSNEMQEMSHSDLGSELDLDSEYEEIILLKDSFNNMNFRLKEQFGRQKRFSANAAHELKTPIAVMKTACQILDNESDLSDYQESNQIIERNVNKLDSIVTDLLELANEEELVKDSMVNMSQLIISLENELNNLARVKNIKFVNDLDDSIIITCNRTLVTRVISNLLTNSIKYNKEDGKIYVTLNKENSYFTIVIADTGIGIEDDKIKDIFEPFYRIDKHHVAGSGLGLSIVKKGIDLLGWSIDVQSVLGEKTIFTIIIN